MTHAKIHVTPAPHMSVAYSPAGPRTSRDVSELTSAHILKTCIGLTKLSAKRFSIRIRSATAPAINPRSLTKTSVSHEKIATPIATLLLRVATEIISPVPILRVRVGVDQPIETERPKIRCLHFCYRGNCWFSWCFPPHDAQCCISRNKYTQISIYSYR